MVYYSRMVKDEVLKILESNRERFTSGQELATALGVTRTAVWKAVNALISDGHDIEAVSSKGYRLTDESDVLTAVGIQARMKNTCEVRVYDCVESTNKTAKLAAVEGVAANTIIVANEQTGGKGRRGRSFFSPKGTGVYFSVVLKPRVSAEKSVLVTTAAAVAAADAIESLTGKTAQIKWINDIYVDGRKCVGILTEAIFDYESGGVDSVIVGTGVNVTTANFPDEIADRAGSVGKISRNALVAVICDRLIELANVLPSDEHLAEYRKKCFVLGKRIHIIGKDCEYDAEALNVDDNGGLVVRTDDGDVVTLSNEEVSIRVRGDEQA